MLGAVAQEVGVDHAKPLCRKSLSVAETDDDDAIKKAYLRQVREHPPERDPERFQAIRTAYDAIKTRRDRLHYRLFGQESPDLAALAASACGLARAAAPPNSSCDNF